GLVAGLVLLEPDFGTAALAVGLLVFMLFVGGVPARLMALPALTALPALAAVAWRAPYRWARIVAFLYPDRDPLGVNFQLQQSFIAFGSGGLWGVGLGASQQKMFYLPEAHTDFLFSVIGEELGLAGALVVLALFAVVAARGFRIAVRHQDPFASLLAFGVTLSLVLQGGGAARAVAGLASTARGTLRALVLLGELRPRLVVGVGGYASVAVVIAAALRRVPTVLLEQNVVPGAANRVLARLARRICVG